MLVRNRLNRLPQVVLGGLARPGEKMIGRNHLCSVRAVERFAEFLLGDRHVPHHLLEDSDLRHLLPLRAAAARLRRLDRLLVLRWVARCELVLEEDQVRLDLRDRLSRQFRLRDLRPVFLLSHAVGAAAARDLRAQLRRHRLLARLERPRCILRARNTLQDPHVVQGALERRRGIPQRAREILCQDRDLSIYIIITETGLQTQSR